MASEYDFTLALSGFPELTPELVDALFEAGCDDATFTTRSGRHFATFSRRAASFKEAALTAIRNIRKASPDLHVIRVETRDPVTQASELDVINAVLKLECSRRRDPDLTNEVLASVVGSVQD